MTTGHEVEDAPVKPILLAMLVLAVGTALVFVIVFGVLRFLEANPVADRSPNPMAVKREASQGPHIEEHPMVDYRELRSREDHLLTTYGWADKKAGAVRIPVDRAMELLLQRGLTLPKEAVKK